MVLPINGDCIQQSPEGDGSKYMLPVLYYLCSLFASRRSEMQKDAPTTPRRPLIAVIGAAGAKESDAAYQSALSLGELLVDAGFRVCSGGLTGVMNAAFAGARNSKSYKEGDTVAIIPTLNHDTANQYSDIVIATGLGQLRNGIVAASEAVVAVGGKAGTLSEIALAWRHNRLIAAVSESGGMAAEYAGKALDDRSERRHHALATIADTRTPQDAVDFLLHNLPECYQALNSKDG